jgi:hypothetical protein
LNEDYSRHKWALSAFEMGKDWDERNAFVAL